MSKVRSHTRILADGRVVQVRGHQRQAPGDGQSESRPKAKLKRWEVLGENKVLAAFAAKAEAMAFARKRKWRGISAVGPVQYTSD